MTQDFSALLLGLTSPDTAVRSQFEKTYQEAKAVQPDLIVENLAAALGTAEPVLQQLAAVLLRRCLEDETEQGAWHRLNDERRKRLRHEVLVSASRVVGRMCRKAVTHVVAQLSRLCLHEDVDARNEWPELFKFMFEMSQSPDPELRESGFEMFSAVAEYAPRAVGAFSTTIGQVLGKGLGDADSVDVRLASLRALASLMVSLELKQLEPFRQAIPMMLQTLRNALDQAATTKDERLETICRDALKSFVEVVSKHPKFLRSDFADLAQSMIVISTAQGLDSTTRGLGLEVLVASSESMASFLRKEHPNLASELVPLGMRLLCEKLDPEPDMPLWEANLDADAEGEDDDEDDLVAASESSIHRFAMALGAKTVLPSVLALVPELLGSNDWRRRRTALQTLSLIAEGCGKKLYGKLAEVVRWALQTKDDQHPKVRYAMVHLLGRLCIDFSDEENCGEGKPTFQKKFAKEVLPTISEKLRDPSARVATHAASSLVNYFVEFLDVTPAEISPYLDSILEGLMMQVTNGALTTKDEALTAVSSIATVAGPALFVRYYDHLMPLALSVASANTYSASERVSSLKGRALECAGLMASAVGKEKFSALAPQTVQLVMHACKQKEDSTLRRYAMAASVRIARPLQGDFLPYLAELVPEMVAGCKEDFGIELIDEGAMDEMQARGFQVVQFQVRGEGLKTVKVNSAAVQEISTCVFALYNLANDFKELFASYAPEAFMAILPLLDADGLDAIRNIAIVALPHILRCVVDQQAVASDLFMVSFFALLSKLESEEDEILGLDNDEADIENSMETSLHLAESLTTILRTCYESNGAKDNDPHLNKRITQHPPKFGFSTPERYAEAVNKCSEALQRRVEILVESRAQFQEELQEHDEASQEKFLMQDSKHVEIAERLVDCAGYLLKLASVNPALLVKPVREHMVPLMMTLTVHEARGDIAKLGLCLLDDFLEFIPVFREDVEVRQRCVKMCLEASKSDDNSLARAAVWGLGIAAVYAGPDLDSKVVECVRVLGESVEMKRAQMAQPGIEEETQFELGLVVDNALSALEKFCRHRGQVMTKGGIPAESVMQRVIQLLPCKMDAEEAKVVNVQLARYVGTPLLSQETYTKMLLAQLAKGYDESVSNWEEEDAFLDEQTRFELAQGIARGTLPTPSGLNHIEMAMLAELGKWFAKKSSSQ